MFPEFVLCTVIVLATSFGLAWPVAAQLPYEPALQLLASLLLSLLGVWLIAWSVYVLGLPANALWSIPILTLFSLIAGRRSFAALTGNRTVRALITGQLLVSGWCVGFLALIASYSGGDWVGDWFGHWDRTIFFLARGPHDFLFTGFDPLPSRPPLVNVVVGAWLRVSRFDFAHYQLTLTVFNSLAFLPAALLARRFGHSDRPVVLFAVLLMINPFFLQNATYAWTKLASAVFVLAAILFFLQTFAPGAPRSAGVLCAVGLGGACLAHYSAGPYVVMLILAWLAFGWTRRRDPAWWRDTAIAAGAGGLVLAVWFGWAFAIYGFKGTFLSNTSVTDAARAVGSPVVRGLLNLRDTLVPHFARTVDFTPYIQRSPWGGLRDWFFPLYQMNLPLAAGSVAWAAILLVGFRRWLTISMRHKVVSAGFTAGVVILGVAVVGSRGPLGLAHICLQPLLLCALALLAAEWTRFKPVWRRLLLAGATFDFCSGIALHFGGQSQLLDRWLAPNRPAADTLTSYSEFALMNLRAKHQLGLKFFGEALAVPPLLVLALLAALLALALIRVARMPTANDIARAGPPR